MESAFCSVRETAFQQSLPDVIQHALTRARTGIIMSRQNADRNWQRLGQAVYGKASALHGTGRDQIHQGLAHLL
jgi:hypothetical protein